MADTTLILAVAIPVGLLALVVIFFVYFKYCSRKGESTFGTDRKEMFSAQMDFDVDAMPHTPMNGNGRHHCEEEGPPSLGLGALFPAAADKTPSVMTQSIAKGMQEARINGAGHGAFASPNLNGNEMHLPSIQEMPEKVHDTYKFEIYQPGANTPVAPKVLDMGTNDSKGHPIGAPPVIIAPPSVHESLQGNGTRNGGFLGRPIALPSLPAQPAAHKDHRTIGMQQEGGRTVDSRLGSALEPLPMVEEIPVHSAEGASSEHHKAAALQGTAAVRSPDPATVDPSTMMTWRDATVIDDTPLQQQFEDFIRQLKTPASMGSTPRARKKGSARTPRAVVSLQNDDAQSHLPPGGSTRIDRNDPSDHVEVMDVTGSMQRIKYLGMSNVNDPQRKRIMDMHKQMFDGQQSMSDPVELPGDKGISFYQGASSLNGRMTSVNMDNIPDTETNVLTASARAKREKPVITEIRDEDEMWG